MYDEFDDTERNQRQEINGGTDPEPQTFFNASEEPVPQESAAQESAEQETAASREDAYVQPEDMNQNMYAQQPEDMNQNTYSQHSAEQQDGQTSGRQGAPHGPSGFQHYSYGQQNNSFGQNGGFHQRPGQGTFQSQKPKKQKANGKKPFWKSVAVCASLAVVFGVVGSAAFQATNYVGHKIVPQETEAAIGKAEPIAPSDSSAASGTAVSTASDVSQVAKNTMPSIVAITNKGVEEVESMFFGQKYTQQTESAGSGVIISENDTELLIATNNHVVEGAEELSVCFSVDTENPEEAIVQAQIKGTDADHDLAVVAVNKADIPDTIKSQIKVINIGDSSKLEIGQQVIAIGNALGYGQSLTVGYISALDREVTIDNVTNKLIQTDAAINFGNSGGALLNAAGELIGINSAKAAASGVEGMGYAIPMSTAQPILNDLANRTTRSKVDDTDKGYLGIVPRDVSDEAKEVYNMPAGAYVYEVTEGSAAATAGIKKGDIIVKLDGESISSRSDLFERMNYYKAGETIEVVVSTAQNGEYVERTVSVTLGQKPEDTTSANDNSSQNGSQNNDQGNGQTIPDYNQGNGQDGYEYYYNYGDGQDGQSMNPFQQLIP